jgi:hypothetical protein
MICETRFNMRVPRDKLIHLQAITTRPGYEDRDRKENPSRPFWFTRFGHPWRWLVHDMDPQL